MYSVEHQFRLGCKPVTSAGVLCECCTEMKLKIPDQSDGCLCELCVHQHAHLPPVPHLLNPWINLMSRGQGQDFNKYPTKLSNLMSAQWMILYVRQTPTAKHFQHKLDVGFEAIMMYSMCCWLDKMYSRCKNNFNLQLDCKWVQLESKV